VTAVTAQQKRGKEKKSAQTEICSGFIEFSLRLFRRLKWYFLAGFDARAKPAASLSKAKATPNRNSRRGDGSHCAAKAGKRKKIRAN